MFDYRLTKERMFARMALEQMFSNVFSKACKYCQMYIVLIGVNIMSVQMRKPQMTAREFQTYKRKLKRERELRNRLFLVIITVFLILSGVIFYHSIQSQANEDIDDISFKYFSSIMVNYGDSLWSIAEEYSDEHYKSNTDYIAEIVKINHLSNEEIIAGQHIIIPYYSKEFIK